MKDIFQGPGTPFTADDFSAAITTITGAAPTQDQRATLWAILKVESRGFGFQTDRRPKILYERHIFHKRTGGVHSAAHPSISNKAAGGYIGGSAEYTRLKAAMALDRIAALESASWGLGQVMGFNAGEIGYADVDDMVADFVAGEGRQLHGCAAFIAGKSGLRSAFLKKDWDRIAFFYNGSGYAAKGYHTKIEAAYKEYVAKGVPDAEVRAVQACLVYLGYDPKGIDGSLGPGTRVAIQKFGAAMKPPAPAGTPPETLYPAIKKEAGF